MWERAVIAVLSAALSGVVTYGASVLELRGRLDNVERSLMRIEGRLFPINTP